MRTYTINEVAALTGRHPNTIRQKIKAGQLDAAVQQGKFGEEYRIARGALVHAGLLAANGPLEEIATSDAGRSGGSWSPASNGQNAHAVLDAEFVPDAEPAPPELREAERPPDASATAAVAALGELYQRHEQAMFRLGYLQGEMERLKALAETAESLRQDNTQRQQELEQARAALEEKEHRAAEAETLRQELARAQERLREMEAVRQDLEQLKSLARDQETQIITLQTAARKPWWQFWSR